MADAMRENEIQAKIREALNRTDRVRLVRNSVGFDEIHKVRYGLGNGSPDLIGALRDGRVFAIECKRSAGGRVSLEQAAWWIAARRWGVTGGFARSVDEAMKLLDEAEESKKC